MEDNKGTKYSFLFADKPAVKDIPANTVTEKKTAPVTKKVSTEPPVNTETKKYNFLFGAKASTAKPDYDQQIENKIIETKAADAGLVDGVKPFTPELLQAKADKVQPFINPNDNTIDTESFLLQEQSDKEETKKWLATNTANKLGVDASLVEKIFDFENYLTPIPDNNLPRIRGGSNLNYPMEKQGLLLGTVANFNQGVANALKLADQTTTTFSNALGFKAKSSPFKYLQNIYEAGGSKSGYVMPEGFLGEVVAGIAQIAPEIMFFSPEVKIAQLSKITGGLINKLPVFPLYLGAKQGMDVYSQTGKTSDFYFGMGKGITEGLSYKAFGEISKTVGNLARGFVKNPAYQGIVSKSTAATANALLFGGSTFTSPEVWDNGKLNWEKAKEQIALNIGIGLGLSAKSVGQEALAVRAINSSMTKKAVTSFWTSNSDMIKTGLESHKSQRELRKESNALWEKATMAENPVERNQYLLAKQGIDNITLTRPIAEMVSKNPQKFRELVNSDKRLTDQEKKYYNDKINDTVEIYKDYETTGEQQGKFEKDYLVWGKKATRKDVIDHIKSATDVEELRNISYPKEKEIEIPKLISERRKEINQETVKAEKEKLLTEKKTDISELQKTAKQPVTKSEQKGVTVKENYDKVTDDLGLKKPVPYLEGKAKSGKINGVDVVLNEGKNPNEMVLESIKTPWWNRNKGKAKEALKKITDQADAKGMDIRLRAVPEKGAKITEEQLKKFYEKNGFEFKEGSNEGVRKIKPEIAPEIVPEVKTKVKKAVELQDKIEETKGASKKRKLREERDNILGSDEKLKYIDDNIEKIMESLEKSGKLKRGPCPV